MWPPPKRAPRSTKQKLREARLAIFKAQEARRQQAQQMRAEAMAEARARSPGADSPGQGGHRAGHGCRARRSAGRNRAPGQRHHPDHSEARRNSAGSGWRAMNRKSLRHAAAIAFMACLFVCAAAAQEAQSSSSASGDSADPSAAEPIPTRDANAGIGEILAKTTEQAAHSAEKWGHSLGIGPEGIILPFRLDSTSSRSSSSATC